MVAFGDRRTTVRAIDPKTPAKRQSMRMPNRNLKIFAAVLCISSMAWASLAFGQADDRKKATLSISPAIVEKGLDAGVPAKSVIRLINLSDKPIEMKVFPTSLKVQEDTSKLTSKQKATFDARSWITIPDPRFVLAPDELREVNVIITAPPDAEPGGHYATVIFDGRLPQEESPGEASSAPVVVRVGAQMFLTVKGDIVEKLVAVGPVHTKPLLVKGKPDFRLRVRNEGNVHLIPAGDIKISNWRGKEKASLPLKSSFILPHTEKNYEFKWRPKKLFGRYSVTAEASYGFTGIELQIKPRNFWIIPWQLLVAASLVLLYMVYRIRKTVRRVLLKRRAKA